MSLDSAAVGRIARLARIRVEPGQAAQLAQELGAILGWIEQLNEVDVTGVEPLTSITHQAAPLRADAVTDGGYPDAVLANAPEREGTFFVVPKVVE